MKKILTLLLIIITSNVLQAQFYSSLSLRGGSLDVKNEEYITRSSNFFNAYAIGLDIGYGFFDDTFRLTSGVYYKFGYLDCYFDIPPIYEEGGTKINEILADQYSGIIGDDFTFIDIPINISYKYKWFEPFFGVIFQNIVDNKPSNNVWNYRRLQGDGVVFSNAFVTSSYDSKLCTINVGCRFHVNKYMSIIAQWYTSNDNFCVTSSEVEEYVPVEKTTQGSTQTFQIYGLDVGVSFSISEAIKSIDFSDIKSKKSSVFNEILN